MKRRQRLILLVKSGKIGKVVSVDAVCTSLREEIFHAPDPESRWNSVCWWGPSAMLPVFQLLGTDYTDKRITTLFVDREANIDAFTKIDFTYPDAVASVKVALAAKAEGELVVAGTRGYIYVPAPWWKTDYFELRYENPAENRRFFYQLDGEGIRYAVVAFAKQTETLNKNTYLPPNISSAIAGVINDFNRRKDMTEIR